MILSLLLLLFTIGCYAVSQLHLHKKGKWQKPGTGFFSEDSDKNKYRNADLRQGERWPTSTNFTVAFTDLYHASQSVMFILLSLAFAIALSINFFLVWLPLLFIHFLYRKFLSK
jgi:hypothetical protein